MSRHTWDTETPWPAPMNETEAAKALSAWEERLRVEREGRDLPPEPGDSDEECRYCGSTNGFEELGFGEGGPRRCKGCGSIVETP